MVNLAQHKNDMKLIDEVDEGMPMDDADNKDLSGADRENEELLNNEK